MGYVIGGLAIIGGSIVAYWGTTPPAGFIPGVMVGNPGEIPDHDSLDADAKDAASFRTLAVIAGSGMIGMGIGIVGTILAIR